MFVINEDKSIYLTRGDVAFFSVSVKSDTGEVRKFQPGEVVRFKVYGKKNCENVVLQKDFGIEEETEKATIYLEEKDTKIGDVISKPTTYWYEVELNPYTNPQTIIGYDDDGAKVFMLYPEGNEAEDNDPITPEDVPVVDTELSLTSTRPVENQAIARAVTVLNKATTDLTQELAVEKERINSLIASGKTEGLSEYEFTIKDAQGKTSDAKIISNGIVAVIKITSGGEATVRNEAPIEFAVPEEFACAYEGGKARMGGVTDVSLEGTEWYLDNLIGVYIHDSCNFCIRCEPANDFGGTIISGLEICYPLKTTAIPEILDARIGTDGERYDTLGDALRGEINKAFAKISHVNSSTTSIRMDIGTARVTSNGINAVMELTLNGLEIPEWSNIIICSNFPIDLYPLGIGQPTFTLDKKYPNIDVIFNGAEIIISNTTDEKVVVEYGERFNIQYALANPHILEINQNNT